jgi:signal transduction histidine kinase
VNAIDICRTATVALASNIRRNKLTPMALVWLGFSVVCICAVIGGAIRQGLGTISLILAILLGNFIVFMYSAAIGYAKRAEALLAGEQRLLEMVALATPLPPTLDALCRLFDASAEGCSSGVLVLDRTGTRIQHAVAPGLPSSYNKSLEGRSVSSAVGPSGMAAILRTQVIVSDAGSDTRWDSKGWPALAFAHGLKSCWSSPILSLTGEVLGAFAIYQGKAGSPTPFHQALIQRFTHISSIAIQRRRNEDALKQSEVFLAQTQRLSLTGAFSWRVVTDEITWSEQVYRIFELDPAVPVTLALILTRLHPEDIASFEEMLVRQRRDGSDFEHDHRLLMPDHSVKYLHVAARAMREQDGQLVYIAAVQDVTQRRLSEEALSKVRSELARVTRVTSLEALSASIAHEVYQPLSGIITNASTCLRMLAADPPNVDGASETARRTLRDGNRASEVIRRLRALFSKKNAVTDSVDLNEATREVIALSLSELQRSRLILRAELAKDLRLVTGDRVQLQQVILNLLRNASDAMSAVDDRPRQLLIRTENDGDDRVRVSVQDAGVGLDPQGADKLFDAFYTTKSDGMGIGLTVSRSIIESHHGRLWAIPNDGPGATFSFSIPRRLDDMTRIHSLGSIRTPAVTDRQCVMGIL